ncbi:putative carbonic anhydrase [Aspergillus candidus]|uniref:carbonic anhydrase n=1 Tax=Aspergillus candidus TaxID=41067 RepID=A0A2I2FAE0_ASPCN|nr:putative carbonic anhydrase [Aspergillus candidus]PLB37587.1 putative carbonic anhydrase [Aspergillus candidus]
MKLATVLSLAVAVSAYCCVPPVKPAGPEGHAHTFNFDYEGETGPLNWHHIDRDNSQCAHGKHQSPIDISSNSVTIAPRGSVRINIPKASTAKLENLGSGLEVVLTNGSLTTPNGNYQLAQFHWHTPSEHRISAQHSPMEAHFVFKDAASRIAVVGFLIELSETGSSTCLFDSIFSLTDAVYHPGEYVHTGPLDFTEVNHHLDLNPPYQYSGSLTTPPCTEGVSWYVSSEPMLLSVRSYNKAKRLLKFNARYIQNTLGAENLLQVAED